MWTASKARTTAAILILLVGLILTYLARQAAPSYQKCQAEENTNSASQQQVETNPGFFQSIVAPKCTVVFLDTNNGFITAIATVLLTIVTGGLIQVGYLQFRTTRGQLRAYVLPDQVGIIDGISAIPPNPKLVGFPNVTILMKNSGQTPAFQVFGLIMIDIIDCSNEDKLIVPKLAKLSPLTLGAGCTFPKSVWFGRALTPYEVSDVNTGVKGIYAYGRLEYMDAFGRPWFTNYRFKYTGGVYPPPFNATVAFCDAGNEAS